MKRFIVSCAVFLSAVLLFQCSFEKPVAPQWDVDFMIPLLRKTLTMQELADENDYLTIDDQNNNVVLMLEDSIDIDLAPLLEIPIPGGGASYPLNVQSNIDVGIPTQGILVTQQAVFESGTLTFVFQNNNNVAVTVDIGITDLFEADGTTPVTLTITVSANNSASPTIDLSGLIFKPIVSGGQNRFRMTINPAPGQTGQILIDWSFDNTAIQSITGNFNQVQANFDDIELEMDIPEFLEDFLIQTAILRLAISMGLRLPVTLHLEAIGLDKNDQVVATLSPPVNENIPAWNGIGQRPVAAFQQDVAAFINTKPKKIVVSGYIRAGDGSLATVSNTDPIDGTVTFEAPLIMSLPALDYEMDVDTLELDKDAREAIRDYLMRLALVGEVQNHLPFGASVTMLFSTTRGDDTIYDPAYTPDLTIPIVVTSAATSGTPGIVTAPQQSIINVDLQKPQLALFEEPTLYFGLKFEFSSSTAGMVKVSPTDSIQVSARLEARVHVAEPTDSRRNGGAR
ncbi:MAG TPA: hypothetical protein ENN03_09495 [bacterium]|nr:hypothetical protein [bacterium]